MTRPSVTCPRCGATSGHPMDVKMGYCGACHDFTSPAQDQGAELPGLPDPNPELILSVTKSIMPTLIKLDPPRVLNANDLPATTRTMLAEMPDVSVRMSDTVFYDPDGAPIDAPVRDALAYINRIRDSSGSIDDHIMAVEDVDVHIHTGYLGVDISQGGPLPLIWETLVLVGGLLSHPVDPWRYANRATAYHGHAEVVKALRQAIEQA